ncbi:hypothetical protein Slin14017_G129120 [Septoria linicola]|nr:hypothetical protein Slin14017_G129120 [Septoria linicola]
MSEREDLLAPLLQELKSGLMVSYRGCDLAQYDDRFEGAALSPMPVGSAMLINYKNS